MHLITPLAAGVRGAESGRAEIYARGTSTRATYYTAFEGGTGASANVALDSNGGAEIYVDQVVDVLVYGYAGTLVREFTAGASSPAVEVRSNSFTGTHYVTGASAAGNPTTLQTVLDKWATSAGTTDFKVLFGGAATSLSTAVGAVSGLFFNVKAYGALGDGTTDDTAAISAAMTAATVSGGTVLFPPGTYRTTAVLTVPNDVNLVGMGTGVSIIALDHATAQMVLFTASGDARRLVFGLTFRLSQSNNNAASIGLNGTTKVRFFSCEFEMANLTGGCIFLSGGDTAEFSFCEWNGIGTNGGAIVGGWGANAQATLSNCYFETSATSLAAATTPIVAGLYFRVSGCVFNMATLTSGSGVAISPTNYAHVIGCDFLTGGATTTCLRTNTITGTDFFYESGNTVAGGGVLVSAATAATTQIIDLRSRTCNKLELTDNTATLQLTVAQVLAYGIIVIKRTTNTDQTVDMSLTAGLPSGLRTTIIYWNESGGNIANVTVNAPGGSVFGLNNNLAATWTYVSALIEAAATVPILTAAVLAIGDP